MHTTTTTSATTTNAPHTPSPLPLIDRAARDNPEVWFAIPSASVERCRLRLPEWRDRGYRIAILQNRERAIIPADITVWSDTYPGWAESVNILCRSIVPATAHIVVSGGDDMLPVHDRTAQELAREYFDRFPQGFGVMQPAADTYLWAANYCGSPWFARPFFSSMYQGHGPMFGGYRHNWADYELHWVARCIDALWMRPDIAQHHAHFTRDNQQPPEWWTANVAAHDQHDCQLFLARKYRNFPGHEPLNIARPFNTHELLTRETGIAEWRWNNSYAPHASHTHPAARLTKALQRCADDALHRVAIYGAGTHTRRAAQAIAQPPVNIIAIIDDNPSLHDQTLWNYPITSLQEAIRRGAQAIIISSDSHEPAMAQRAAEAASHRSIPIIRLYDHAAAPTEPHAQAHQPIHAGSAA